MKILIYLSVVVVGIFIFGCKEEVKVTVKPEVKIDSSKLTPSVTMPNKEFNISYQYLGAQGLTSTKILRKLTIKLTVISYDTTNLYHSSLKLKIKNTSFEPFILSGEDIFILKNGEILGKPLPGYYRVDIESGKELEFSLQIPKTMATDADLIDVRKRAEDGLISAFQIKL